MRKLARLGKNNLSILIVKKKRIIFSKCFIVIFIRKNI